MKRIKLTIQYLGTNYAGWQVQPNLKTIQGEIQNAIKLGLGEECEIFGSGRTDAGVHAFGQVAHFDTNTKINPHSIYAVINRFLPKDIRILKSEEVESTFHARFDVKQKTYEYHFYQNNVVLPLLDGQNAFVAYDFNFEKASKACEYFLGTHDFCGFCSAGGKKKDTTRTIYSISLNKKQDSAFYLSITGNGFLYNMVRIIAGTIIEVGCGKILPEDILDIINSKERSRAGRTASARGLVLKKVEY